MKKNLFYRYLILLSIIIACVLLTGIVINYYTYRSLKNTVCKNLERTSSLLVNDIAEHHLIENETIDNNVLKIYCQNALIDIYIYDENENEITSCSAQDSFISHVDWDFSKSQQTVVNSDTNICLVKKCYRKTGSRYYYICSVTPYTEISVHTDKILSNIWLSLAISSGVFSAAYWSISLIRYRYIFKAEKSKSDEALNDAIERYTSKYVIPEYRPLLNSVKILQERLNDYDAHMVEFISNISHELKTPLTVIIGFIQAYLEGVIEKEQRDKYLIKVMDEAGRMNKIVKNMLKVSNIEAGKITLNIKTFDITDTISDIILSFEKNIEKKQVRVISIPYPEIMVSADQLLIHQIFYNLIENAVKFVNEGGLITISVAYKNDNICFYIRNTGSGIPHKKLIHIFDRFYKADYSRSENPDGVGLGLSIVKKFVNMHKGTITINSIEGKYTEFTIAFPSDFAAKKEI